MARFPAKPETDSAEPRDSIHVACLPYPSAQGTQAWLKMALNALADAARRTTLLCYDASDVGLPRGRFKVEPVHGTTASLRSGPSFAKIRSDLRMIPALRAAARKHPGARIVAHNVESAWVCHVALGARPWLYVAHTRMDEELPTYGSVPGLRSAGRLLDRVACATPLRAAVSPDLAKHVGGTFLPVPWALAPPAHRQGAGGSCALYAGNLDGYQDVPALAAAKACGYRLIVATESDPAPLRGLDVEAVLPIRSEADRQRAYAMADVALVPRRAAGGLPMKLLDALARAVPVAATRRALAGLEPDGVSVGETLRAALLRHRHRPTDGEAGRAWLAREMSPARFTRALDAALTPANR